MKTTEKRFSLRISALLLDKLDYIATYNDRSINGELQTLIKDHITKFEKEHGAIDTENE